MSGTNTKKTIYSFIGLPASGKGTQAKLLAEKLGVAKPIGIGDLVREVIDTDSTDPFVVEIKERYNAGTPQPDSVAIDLLEKKLNAVNSDIILDNFPFTTGQAKFLEDYVASHEEMFNNPVIIYIKVDPDTAIRRTTLRKVCSECGQIFAATDDMICEKCGGSLIVRSDDNVETVRTRIEHYLPKINEVIDYLKNSDWKVAEINGETTPAEVSKEIANEL